MKHFKFKHKYLLVLGTILFIIAAIDFLNVDRLLYFGLCSFFVNLGFKNLVCTTYYDLPIWQTELVAVLIVTAYFAFHRFEKIEAKKS
jgi:hypothetical protein